MIKLYAYVKIMYIESSTAHIGIYRVGRRRLASAQAVHVECIGCSTTPGEWAAPVYIPRGGVNKHNLGHVGYFLPHSVYCCLSSSLFFSLLLSYSLSS
jgi:hypothetical protein